MKYEGTNRAIVEKLLKLDGPFSEETAFFAPIPEFEKFRKLILMSRDLGENVREWDYNLRIGDDLHVMKLVWIHNFQKFVNSFDVTIPEGYKEPDIFNPNVKKAFSFLRPKYLKYMDKPFYNPDAITQVLLVLDYHRQQKRRRGIEIFNIFDLVAFKMAIDDNRKEYLNCEFHKLITKTLLEMHQNKQYLRDNKFYLNDYLSDKWIVGLPNEKLDYLLYHFQDLIGYVSWKLFDPFAVKLSDIPSVPAFLNYLAEQSDHVIQVTETDSSEKCADVLYDIITKAKSPIKLEFKLDSDWIFTRDSELIKNAPDTISACEFTIDTKNSLNFVDHFIDWLKFAFGKRCHNMKLMILNCTKIRPETFNEFHFDSLGLFFIELSANLIQTLKKCTYENIAFWHCRIANDIYERVELMGHQMEMNQNIFKYLDELDNVKYINLVLEEHTIGTLWAYVESVMTKNKLTKFQFKNRIQLVGRKIIYLNDVIFCLNGDFNQSLVYLDMQTIDGARFDFYEFLWTNNLEKSEQEDFDNNCELYENDDQFDFIQQIDDSKQPSDLNEFDFYN